MGKENDVAVQRAQATDEPISALADLRWRFIVWAPVANQIPAGSFLANIYRTLSFAVVLVPFSEIRFNFFGRRQFTQRCGVLCALTWTGEDAREVYAIEPHA